MAKDEGIIQTDLRRRTPLRAAEPAPKKSFNLIQFAREVRAEGRKVTWTSWKETWITSVMVGIMVILAAGFFFGVDWLLGLSVDSILKLVSPGGGQ
ncbi:MAG: preprotein translocase subunit SecE [Caulobacterales bacterium]